MNKTTVYLSEDEARELRRVALETGVSQSDLIRQGVRAVTGADAVRERRFHSMAAGRSSGSRERSWSSEDLLARRRGRS